MIMTYDQWKSTDEAANDGDRRGDEAMPTNIQNLTRWTIVSARNKEVAWVTLERGSEILVSQNLGPLDSFAARELAQALVAAADFADEYSRNMHERSGTLP